MTYKELLEELQKLPPKALKGKVDVLDTRTNYYYPVDRLYNQKHNNMGKEGYYTFLTFESKRIKSEMD